MQRGGLWRSLGEEMRLVLVWGLDSGALWRVSHAHHQRGAKQSLLLLPDAEGARKAFEWRPNYRDCIPFPTIKGTHL